ncbi:MAG: pyridoxamine 5'-phosphate oxidase [Rhodobacterales bacterium]|nr:MAG: pyridoxamine 5'-phosphate oxidase [Rhodobacterales bacterium]
MTQITTVAQLEALYGDVAPASLDKVATQLTPMYWRWISRSRFCVLSTVGQDGTDGSPRGDSEPVVTSPDPQTLLLPDWRGNNRIDTLRNLVVDPRVSLMFMVPGSDNVVRVNGTAAIETGAICDEFAREGKHPRCVIRVRVAEVYSQCARAIKRARLWAGEDESAGLPTAGAFVKEQKADFDADAYDAAWPARAAKTMW